MMILSREQKTMMAIIETFENGRPNLFHRTYWNPKTKELSGGLFMASTLSGNLGRLLRVYQLYSGSSISDGVIKSVEDETILNSEEQVQEFILLFKNAAEDPIMKKAQLNFFAGQFLVPAEKISASLGITEPLGRLVVMDSFVQGAFKTVKAHVEEHYPGTTQDLNQWDVIRSYMKARRDWLATNKHEELHKTVDRMDSLIPIEKSGNWKLELPITLVTKGYTITEKDIA